MGGKWGVGVLWGRDGWSCAMGQDGVGLCYGAGWIAALWGRMAGCIVGQDGVGLSYRAGWMAELWGRMVWG